MSDKILKHFESYKKYLKFDKTVGSDKKPQRKNSLKESAYLCKKELDYVLSNPVRVWLFFFFPVKKQILFLDMISW